MFKTNNMKTVKVETYFINNSLKATTIIIIILVVYYLNDDDYNLSYLLTSRILEVINIKSKSWFITESYHYSL